jgi:plasmid stabilization system protein ParE
MVYEVTWTLKAVDSYARNMLYLEQSWTQREIEIFISALQRKLDVISRHPYVGSARSKKDHNTRFTILNKRVILIYKVKSRNKQIEILLFWNTWQHPKKLKI